MLAKKLEVPFYETSAKENINIKQIFEKSALKILEKIDNGEIDVDSDYYGVKVGKKRKRVKAESKRSH